MNEPAQKSVVCSDFPGLVNTADSRDVPPGTGTEQVNLVSRVSGELTPRPGIREVTFEN